ncbi:4742_t:CDS:1, partial [Acaulospora colombiana]
KQDREIAGKRLDAKVENRRLPGLWKKERSGAGPLGSKAERRKGIRGETAAWSIGRGFIRLTAALSMLQVVAVEPLKATVVARSVECTKQIVNGLFCGRSVARSRPGLAGDAKHVCA